MIFWIPLLLIISASAEQYPSTYPFENEREPPPTLRPSTPSYTFDESDEGGYNYAHGETLELVEDMLPFCWAISGIEMWFFTSQGIPPVIPSTSWFNCTASNGVPLGPDSYLGVVDNKVICEKGECCSEYMGIMSESAEVNSQRYEEKSKLSRAGVCEAFHEGLYCVSFSNSLSKYCLEQIISVTERQVILPCYDSFYYYFMSCKLYKRSGYTLEGRESAKYVDGCTPEENTAWGSLNGLADRVCRPYSYFFPEFSKFSDADQSTSPTSSAAVFLMALPCLFIVFL